MEAFRFFISSFQNTGSLLKLVEAQEDVPAFMSTLAPATQSVHMAPQRAFQISCEIWSYLNLNLAGRARTGTTFENVPAHEGVERGRLLFSD